MSINSPDYILEEVLSSYGLCLAACELKAQGGGIVNDSYRIDVISDGRRFLLQRLSPTAYSNLINLIINGSYLSDSLNKRRDKFFPHYLEAILTQDGETYYEASDGAFWRLWDYVEGGRSINVIESPQQVKMISEAFAKFHIELNEVDKSKLYPVGKCFHNLLKCKNQYKMALDLADQKKLSCASELVIMAEKLKELIDLIPFEDLPKSLCHNDTKLNNLLLDDDKVLCVVDFDNIMQNGSVLHDFGDMIRSLCRSCPSDEKDLSKLSFNKEFYDMAKESFIAASESYLSDEELKYMDLAPLVITYELALRYLTDYLSGDLYFKTDYAEHNLVRARLNFAYLEKMEMALKN